MINTKENLPNGVAMKKEKQGTGKLQIKEVKNPSRQIQPSTERMLWGVSAGICEFKGCTNKLYLHHITKERINFSEKAHIYAFSKGGKRYSLLKSRGKINDIDNLMLLCEKCHKLIDSEDTDYSAEELLEMKKEHEDRIARLVCIKPDLQSEIIIYNANIANSSIKISEYVAKSAIIPEHYPAREVSINFSPELKLFDSDENYWQVMSQHLERKWGEYESIVRDKHISLFAIAPQPLLFKLGTLLNRSYNVSVRQSQEDIENWKWSSNEKTIFPQVETSPNISQVNEAIISFEITSKLSLEEIREEFGDGQLYRILIDKPSGKAIKSQSDLQAIIELYRECLNNIRETYGKNVVVKLVAIAPVSVSIEAGRQTMKGDPKIIIYDRNFRTKQWVKAIEVNGE